MDIRRNIEREREGGRDGAREIGREEEGGECVCVHVGGFRGGRQPDCEFWAQEIMVVVDKLPDFVQQRLPYE